MFKFMLVPLFMFMAAYGVNAQEQQQEDPWQEEEEFAPFNDEEAEVGDVDLRFGTEVDEWELVGEDDTFPPQVETVYAWTALEDVETPMTVTHVWEYEGQEIQAIELDVEAAPLFRTWSIKTVGPEWVGDWTVRVVDEQGNVLAEEGFTIEEDAEMPEEDPEEENDNDLWPGVEDEEDWEEEDQWDDQDW